MRQSNEQEGDVSPENKKPEDRDDLVYALVAAGQSRNYNGDESGVSGEILHILKMPEEHEVLGETVEHREQQRTEIPVRFTEIAFLEIDMLASANLGDQKRRGEIDEHRLHQDDEEFGEAPIPDLAQREERPPKLKLNEEHQRH